MFYYDIKNNIKECKIYLVLKIIGYNLYNNL